MRQFASGRALPAALLAVLTAAVLLAAGRPGIPAPDALSRMEPESAEAALLGLSRRDILDAWGEPDGTLSGFFGDIYAGGDGVSVIIYYDTEPMGRGTADSFTVPVWSVSLYRSPASLGAEPYFPSS